MRFDGPGSIACLRANLREVHVPRGAGIYFLCDGARVVYIGQSGGLAARLGQHSEKQFDRVFFLPVRSEHAHNISQIESALIRAMRPKLNVKSRATKITEFQQALLSAYGVDDLSALGQIRW